MLPQLLCLVALGRAPGSSVSQYVCICRRRGGGGVEEGQPAALGRSWSLPGRAGDQALPGSNNCASGSARPGTRGGSHVPKAPQARGGS